MAELNEITLDRDQRLVKTQVVSQAQLDTDAANLKNAKAQVAQQQAIIEKKSCARRSPAISGFAPSTSGNISAPALRS